ncbi:MAG: UDP-3-O-(3-hydroxymyristoyl)glucosamine N-acyltransferase [Chryseolinea sp.]
MEIRLAVILNKLPVVETIGNTDRAIENVVGASNLIFRDNDILWVSDKNINLIEKIEKGVVICSENARKCNLKEGCTYLLVNNPRFYFLNLIKTFFVEQEVAIISPRSVIDSTVVIGKNVAIHAGVVLEKNCEIGDDTTIDSNTVVKKGTIIGRRVKIGANNTIGGIGFGYEKDESGIFELIPHIGNVVIEDDVEIGNNTTIDRAVLGSTILRRNCKVDNLVHIAHGAEIGENSLIIANAMIAGSCSIGKDVWVSPSASVLNKIEVGDGAVVGMGAVVLKNVSANQTVVGNPAKDIQQLKSKA